MGINDNPLLPTASSSRYQPRFGKFRGKVLENIDPEERGRIIAEVPAFPGDPLSLSWCAPCVPYAGENVGFFAIPPIGANVWIEYEAGDPNYPIWSGCFWGPGELPLGPDGPLTPETKLWKTESVRLVLNDLPEVGGCLLNVNPPCVATPLSMTFNSTGIELNAEPAIVKMVVEEGINLIYPPCEITMAAEVLEIEIAETTLTLTEVNAAVEAPEIAVVSEGGINVHGGGEMVVLTEGMIDVTSADLTFDALAAEVLAAADITLGAVVSVNVNSVTVELDGIVTIDGQIPLVI